METERNEAVITLNNQVSCLHTQIKSQIDSLEILVAEKSSLERKLDESATLLKTQEGNYTFHMRLTNVQIIILYFCHKLYVFTNANTNGDDNLY